MLILNANATDPVRIAKDDDTFVVVGIRVPGLRHTMSVRVTNGQARIEYANRLPLFVPADGSLKTRALVCTWARKIRKDERADAARVAAAEASAYAKGVANAARRTVDRHDLREEIVTIKDQIKALHGKTDRLSQNYVEILKQRITAIIWKLAE